MTLLVNKDTHEKYKEFCKKQALVMSGQIEKFMKAQMKKGKDRTVLEHILGR